MELRKYEAHLDYNTPFLYARKIRNPHIKDLVLLDKEQGIKFVMTKDEFIEM